MSSIETLIPLAREAAAQCRLDPALVCAVVEQESAWDPCAIRYEPAFRARYVAPLQLTPTEEIARSISWGLLQVMGQLARERGFAGNFSARCATPRQASRSAARFSPRSLPPRRATSRTVLRFGTAARVRAMPPKF